MSILIGILSTWYYNKYNIDVEINSEIDQEVKIFMNKSMNKIQREVYSSTKPYLMTQNKYDQYLQRYIDYSKKILLKMTEDEVLSFRNQHQLFFRRFSLFYKFIFVSLSSLICFDFFRIFILFFLNLLPRIV